jgi:hypothetical protein
MRRFQVGPLEMSARWCGGLVGLAAHVRDDGAPEEQLKAAPRAGPAPRSSDCEASAS